MSSTSLPDEGCVVMPKRVAIGIVIALLMNFAGGVWWVAKEDSRILALEEADTRILGRGDGRYAELRGIYLELKGRVDRVESDRAADKAMLARIEERTALILDTINRGKREGR